MCKHPLRDIRAHLQAVLLCLFRSDWLDIERPRHYFRTAILGHHLLLRNLRRVSALIWKGFRPVFAQTRLCVRFLWSGHPVFGHQLPD